MPVFRPTSFEGIRVEIADDGSTPPLFFDAVESDLRRIASGFIGSDLLELIGKRSRGIGIGPAEVTPDRQKVFPRVTIRYASSFLEAAAKTEAQWDHYVRRKGRFDARDRPFRQSGGGHHMWAFYRPNSSLAQRDADEAYTARMGIRTPAFIVLAHELIHAWHGISGTMELKDHVVINAPGVSAYRLTREEAYTIGLGPYEHTRISENAIRRENRLPVRRHYETPNDLDGFAALRPRAGASPTGQELVDGLAAIYRRMNDW